MFIALMSGEKSVIKLPGRQSIESKKSKLSPQDYDKIIKSLRKENENYTDQIFTLKNILTHHKDSIEDLKHRIKGTLSIA